MVVPYSPTTNQDSCVVLLQLVTFPTQTWGFPVGPQDLRTPRPCAQDHLHRLRQQGGSEVRPDPAAEYWQSGSAEANYQGGAQCDFLEAAPGAAGKGIRCLLKTSSDIDDHVGSSTMFEVATVNI